jgi:hypothetical protein
MALICEQCGQEAASPALLRVHKRSHQLTASVTVGGVSTNLERFSEDDPWVCPVQSCSSTSLNIASLRNHVKRHQATAPDAPSPSVSLCRSSLFSSQSSDPLLPLLQNASESEHHAAQQDSSPGQQLAGNTRRRRSTSQSSSDDSSMPPTASFVGREVGTARESTFRESQLGILTEVERVKTRDSGLGPSHGRCSPSHGRCWAPGQAIVVHFSRTSTRLSLLRVQA